MNAWWQRAWEAVLHDFSDLGDAAQLARLLVRLLMAALLSGVLGWQREGLGKAAGLRTHMLVALGAAI